MNHSMSPINQRKMFPPVKVNYNNMSSIGLGLGQSNSASIINNSTVLNDSKLK